MFLTILALFFTMWTLAPDLDGPLAWDVSTTIAYATDDSREREVLARISALESRLSPRVARCEVLAPGGSLGIFQVVPMCINERHRACGTLEEQTRLALERVRESRMRCAHLEPRDQLSGYTTGRCIAYEPFSRARWGSP